MNINSKTIHQELMRTDLKNIHSLLKGSEIIGNADAFIDRVQMDSRDVQSGDLFIALKGDRFDAHDFLADIAAVPGVTVVVNKSAKQIVEKLKLNAVCVDDTRRALGELAKGWRMHHPLPLIAVTGSNGKTTVTQMIASILSVHAGDNALATKGNLNNDIGLPQTLLRLRTHHTCGVVELGMNHPGEIEYLANIAQPNVALINNAQREHQEFMSTVQAVAIENGQVINSLNASGVAVFPADDEFTSMWIKMCADKRYLTFSDLVTFEEKESKGSGEVLATNSASVQLVSSEYKDGSWALRVNTPVGILDLNLHIAGQHNVKNALAAVACCLALNVPLAHISQGLDQFVPVKGRSRSLKLKFGGAARDADSLGELETTVDVIDDTYNANPDSVIAACNVLTQMSAPTLLILGDMGEVGNEGPSYHKEVGEYAAQKGVDALYALGELTRYTVEAFNHSEARNSKRPALHFSSMDSLIAELVKVPTQYKSVLVKGSRFMRMEQSVQALEALQGQALKTKDAQSTAQHKESTCC